VKALKTLFGTTFGFGTQSRPAKSIATSGRVMHSITRKCLQKNDIINMVVPPPEQGVAAAERNNQYYKRQTSDRGLTYFMSHGAASSMFL
jgi:hypothetical protein